MKVEGDKLIPDVDENSVEIAKLKEGFQMEFFQIDKRIKFAIENVDKEKAHMYNLVNLMHFFNGILDQEMHPDVVGKKIGELYGEHTTRINKESMN